MGFQTRYDAVVVGGGHNGLVAAAYLARVGQSVLLLERNDHLGGATCSEAIFPGMDARLSRYSYLVSLLPRRVVDDLGLSFAWRRRSIASCTPYQRNGTQATLLLSNVDPKRSERSFRELADADWVGYRSFLDLVRTLARKIWPSLLQPLQTRERWMASLQTPQEREAWEALVEKPLGAALERAVHHDLVRGLVFTDAKVGVLTHRHDPTLLQNRCFILHMVGQGTGEWQVPVGGMGALVEALAASARGAGAELVTGAPAEAVHPGAPHHTVVFRHADREHTVEAKRVLVNAGPQVFSRLLGEPYRPVAGDEGSVCKVNMLLLRLPRLKAEGLNPGEAFVGTFHLDEGYEEMQISYRQAAAGRIPDHPPAEIYCHTLTDPSILGPQLQAAGYHTLTLFGLDAPYRLFEKDNEATKAAFLRRYFQSLNRVLAEPIEDCLALDAEGSPCIEVRSPLDLEDEISLNRGNIFHAGLSWFFTDDAERAGSWGVETEHERIYSCGSSAQRGGAVSGIPGYNAAQRIFQELRIGRQLAQV